MTNSSLVSTLLETLGRTQKPREHGITIVLDTGSMGPRAVEDWASSCGAHCDYAKLAWGSALITGALSQKLDAYRRAQITPLLGGTMFEYAFLWNRLEELFAFVREHRLAIEISDGVIDLPRRDRLQWLERFAKITDVCSEIGGKLERQDRDWKQVIREDRAAGAQRIVVEGREIAPVGEDFREDFLADVLAACDPKWLVFEALERRQQVWLIKKLGVNVNLGNIVPNELMTVESFRLGLKEHTLLSTYEQNTRARR